MSARCQKFAEADVHSHTSTWPRCPLMEIHLEQDVWPSQQNQTRSRRTGCEPSPRRPKCDQRCSPVSASQYPQRFFHHRFALCATAANTRIIIILLRLSLLPFLLNLKNVVFAHNIGPNVVLVGKDAQTPLLIISGSVVHPANGPLLF